MTAPLLELHGVSAAYGALPVLDGVDLRLGRGEVLALLGRNGSGRSTLARAVMGMIASSGSIRIDGVEMAGRPTFEIARRGVAYVAERRDVFGLLSVEDNLRLGWREGPRAARERAFDEVRTLFPALAERWRAKAAVLSGGEQQMLALARAMVGAPRLMIVDEPTEGLAPQVARLVGKALARLGEAGVAILLIEQRRQLAATLATRIAVMERGRIVHDGAPGTLTCEDEARWLGAG
ncbi:MULTISPECIES: ABC transporter ATP-binding protein [Burkholderia]|uniref:ABC transporter ATP-binding protein n=1 Tax=Burkholderia TaxID=32008 RepID=UPI00119A6AC4|nr:MULTISPECIES: ABC transporter ATP-binding protein [Burkholderia]MBU9195395.1 ABC transporter ATP-binding protein [Burkholderia gladioli]MDN7738938.1 ABC transporter ATP-binding protein [Burkholderia gladioli]TWC69349.1 amino acid/amide ABC transporter ATP-binding protein 2 (HAAT family) [Burkholderia sp. SJZ089]TWD00858.1 amino acid/amide ABC transporter ATP-binding protein 2 (HAAT family) [Burkholderia sp. SJZ115]TWD04674.1 amino acid/amide ABC transporter ATP-binding protein 2 (HAAT famil